tara:strand:- start:286 stop:432 length:147 start_codon:yes stop_codon:yes gene_type:complete
MKARFIMNASFSRFLDVFKAIAPSDLIHAAFANGCMYCLLELKKTFIT